ncbi:MAG TPA: patatin-like phospholipase family protein [Gemmatimonadales bacterium]|nr:patatin-like phospholipase family protein [Gemmatimonadales bacterium]
MTPAGPRVVAVFSGGGAKAVAAAGAWRALEEANLAPAHIVGTSMGAVIGAAFAAGLTYRAVSSVALGIRAEDIARVDPLAIVAGSFASSFLSERALRDVIARLVPARWFQDLRLPLTVTATDLDSGELVLFGKCGKEDVPLLDALYATCALPLYYPPAVIGARRFADGGLRAVLPLGVALRLQPDVVVAVHVGPGFDEPPPRTSPAGSRGLLPPLLRAHGEAMRIAMAANAEESIRAWPADGPRLVLVRPVAEREATFAIERTQEYIEAGYRATRAALDRA